MTPTPSCGKNAHFIPFSKNLLQNEHSGPQNKINLKWSNWSDWLDAYLIFVVSSARVIFLAECKKIPEQREKFCFGLRLYRRSESIILFYTVCNFTLWCNVTLGDCMWLTDSFTHRNWRLAIYQVWQFSHDHSRLLSSGNDLHNFKFFLRIFGRIFSLAMKGNFRCQPATGLG